MEFKTLLSKVFILLLVYAWFETIKNVLERKPFLNWILFSLFFSVFVYYYLCVNNLNPSSILDYPPPRKLE